MASEAIILKSIKWCLLNIKGNISEKIIQNAMSHQLHRLGVVCQQEVVLPVLCGNVFLGYNRLDIFIPHETKKKKSITILELKLLSNSIKKRFKGSRIEEQCLGYKECATRIFGKRTDIKVYVVNTWRINGKQTGYKNEIIEVKARQRNPKKSKKIARKR